MADCLLYHGLEIAGRTPPFVRELRDTVRARRKTQTRRPMKPQPQGIGPSHWYYHEQEGWWTCGENTGFVWRCPYGRIGDLRVMPEPLKRGKDGFAHYADDGELVVSLRKDGYPLIPWRWQRDTLPSIHMPTEAGRTVLRYTDVRVERLQEISEEDAIAEGVDAVSVAAVPRQAAWSRRQDFSRLWDRSYAKRGEGWDVPQWVWVLAFEEVSA